jgi:hypothetical protein
MIRVLLGTTAFLSLVVAGGDSRAQSDLVAAYGFDETSGGSVLDASGNGNTGSIGTAVRTTAGKVWQSPVVRWNVGACSHSRCVGPAPHNRFNA